MSAINVTALELAAIRAIVFSDFQDSDQADGIIGTPVWSEAQSRADGGVYASLINKGLIGFDNNGPKRDHTVWMLEAARPLVELLLAPLPHRVDNEPEPPKSWGQMVDEQHRHEL